jgi:hypothetical protein
MFKNKEITDLINGYALPKFLLGLLMWNIAVEQFDFGSKGGAMVLGIVAIFVMVDAMRLLRGKYNKCKERKCK